MSAATAALLLLGLCAVSTSEAAAAGGLPAGNFEDLYLDLEEIGLHIIQLVREIPEYGDYLRTIRGCAWNMSVSLDERVAKCTEEAQPFSEMFDDKFEQSVQDSVQKIADVDHYFSQRYFPHHHAQATRLIGHFYGWFLKKQLADFKDQEISSMLLAKLQRYNL